MQNTLVPPTDIVLATLTEADPRIATEYAYYKAHPIIQAQQAEYDRNRELDADFGWTPGPEIDFAWAKAMDRARTRAMPKVDVIAQFRAELALKRYAQATA